MPVPSRNFGIDGGTASIITSQMCPSVCFDLYPKSKNSINPKTTRHDSNDVESLYHVERNRAFFLALSMNHLEKTNAMVQQGSQGGGGAESEEELAIPATCQVEISSRNGPQMKMSPGFYLLLPFFPSLLSSLLAQIWGLSRDQEQEKPSEMLLSFLRRAPRPIIPFQHRLGDTPLFPFSNQGSAPRRTGQPH